MGDRGPVPKRSVERLGHRAKGDRPTQAASGVREPVPAPPARDDWHEIARHWYESLAYSGQARFYEPSDWMTAIVIAEQISRELGEKYLGMTETGPHYGTAPISGQSLSGILKGMTALLATEGDRRRAQLELTRAANEAEENATILELVKTEEDEAFG